ncbi:DUF4244 domain-containing protein [Demequina flava]|uniref:DUF4244 domain-containing protein n=1 Tax=Demequina flava TaxID=1095025 RepID=UPI000AFD6BA6|nr:DUF4244 domain-containing protein [Demequina flava]
MQWWRSRLELKGDEGMATTEYALVTVAAAAFAGLLIAIIRSEEVREMLLGVIRSAFG